MEHTAKKKSRFVDLTSEVHKEYQIWRTKALKGYYDEEESSLSEYSRIQADKLSDLIENDSLERGFSPKMAAVYQQIVDAFLVSDIENTDSPHRIEYLGKIRMEFLQRTLPRFEYSSLSN